MIFYTEDKMFDRADRHIWLYAKGHYKITDTVEDLKKLMGERSNIDPEYITSGDIISVLLSVVYPLISSEEKTKDFIIGLHPENYFKASNSGDYTFQDAFFKKCLSVIRYVTVRKDGEWIIDLGEPDPELLPLMVTNRKF